MNQAMMNLLGEADLRAGADRVELDKVAPDDLEINGSSETLIVVLPQGCLELKSFVAAHFESELLTILVGGHVMFSPPSPA